MGTDRRVSPAPAHPPLWRPRGPHVVGLGLAWLEMLLFLWRIDCGAWAGQLRPGSAILAPWAPRRGPGTPGRCTVVSIPGPAECLGLGPGGVSLTHVLRAIQTCTWQRGRDPSRSLPRSSPASFPAPSVALHACVHFIWSISIINCP